MMAKVYVSSTIIDLESERRAVMEWLRAARHQAVDSYLPNSDTVRDSCLDDVDTCDLYVLILSHRYGFQPEEANPEKLSITHLEFRRAGQSSKPRIALLRTSIPDSRLSDLEDPQRAPRVLAFRAEVRREVRPAEFNDLRGLIQGLSTGVQSELDKLGAPAEHRAEAWLTAHLQHVAKQFTNHIAASALRSGARPEELYLDLVVAERHLGKKEESGNENEDSVKETHHLEDVLKRTQAPLLLIGEGGAGKTTSLLYISAMAADSAKADQTNIVPIYVNLARLTKLDDVPDLLQLIADSVPLVKDWDELYDILIANGRKVLFVFDSFNEMPEHLQRNGAVVLQRFVEKQKDRHTCLIGSRLVPHIEQLARTPSQFKTFEILRLTSDQVRGFLQELGLGSLYERMSGQLRELAGNPFMLLAIARTLAGAPEHTLPRNRGKLYQRFVRGWMDNEIKRRGLKYSYERVKESLLAYLAKHMTSAGQTLLSLTNALEEEVQGQLQATYQRIERRGGMPSNWSVDKCLAEIFDDGLLKQLDEQLYFMHQSVQEYFAGLYFCNACPKALVDFTPRLLSESLPTNALAEVPSHRFVQPLLMMVGLLDDSTEIVEALAARNPILAAAAISSANRVDGSPLSKLERSWLDLLKHDELRCRIVACSCLAHASMTSRQVIQNLVAMALSPDFQSKKIAKLALRKLDAPEAIASELNEQVPSLPDYEYKKDFIREFLQDIQSALKVLTIDDIPSAETMRQSSLPDEQAIKNYSDRVAQNVIDMKSMQNESLIACLRTSDNAVHAAAAKVAGERQLPVGDILLESLLREGRNVSQLISALVSLWGQHDAVSRLVEGSREKCWCVGKLNPVLVSDLKLGELSKSLKDEIEHLGCGEHILIVEGSKVDGSTVIWKLSSSSWSDYRLLYELRVSPERLEFYDCNLAARAFYALAKIPGEASLTELQRAIEHEDPEVRRIAIKALAKRGDQGLAARLLAQLRSTTSAAFVDAALRGLAVLQSREALFLMNDLLITSDGEWSDVHPVWGPCPWIPGWGDTIHRILVTLNADGDIQQALDKALASEDPVPKVAALKEFSRWFKEADLGPERNATWRTPERLQRVLSLALRDYTQSVRTAAAGVLGKLNSEVVQRSLADALADNAAEVQVAAADVLVSIQAQELYGPVAAAMLRVAKADQAQDLRRRAGKVLSAIPGGVEPFYQPIQEELERGESERVLEMIEATLEIIPEDANLFWWRGHALRRLGRLDQAADSFQRAFELEKQASVIPQALALTLLERGEFQRAIETARHAVEIDPGDAEARAILAWSSYKAGAIPEAIEAASKAVDLDPVHGDAIWIVLLGYICQANLEESRLAFHHALRVRKFLSPGIDMSFVTIFQQELDRIETANAEIASLVEEIKETLDSNVEATPD